MGVVKGTGQVLAVTNAALPARTGYRIIRARAVYAKTNGQDPSVTSAHWKSCVETVHHQNHVISVCVPSHPPGRAVSAMSVASSASTASPAQTVNSANVLGTGVETTATS